MVTVGKLASWMICPSTSGSPCVSMTWASAPLSRKYQQERGELEASDPVRVLVGSLWLMLCGREEMEVAPKEVATRMNDEARDQDLTEQGKDFTNARRVGWLLKRLRFERLPNDRTKRWHVPRVELEAIARAYGIALGQEGQATGAESLETGDRETF